MFYSESGEDRWIVRNLLLPERGVYVDVGAADGLWGSNTRYFEEAGWSGLLIEPDPKNLRKLRANRKGTVVDCAIGTSQRPFYVHENPLLSGFLRTDKTPIEVRVSTLEAVLQEAAIAHVDVLSIDAEGSELDVWATLKGYDRPSVVIMEWRTLGMPPNDGPLISRMETDGYRMAQQIGANLIFIPTVPFRFDPIRTDW